MAFLQPVIANSISVCVSVLETQLESAGCYLVLLGVFWMLLSRGFELWLLRGVGVENSLRMN